MAIAGIYPLPPPATTDALDFNISSPATIEGAWVTGFEGARGVEIQANFIYGSGSGGVRLCIQTSLDQGFSYYDVYVLDFAAVARVVPIAVVPATSGVVVLSQDGASGNSPIVTEGLQCSVLGDRLRAKVFVSGTYANTNLSVRVNPIL
jgi:hypothetical protein